jgi:hypothetical protein
MKKHKFLIIIFLFVVLAVSGYVYFNPADEIDDIALYKWINSETDYAYYKNDSSILLTSDETERAHDNYMRVKFNKIAASVLDTDGKLPKGKSFPDSSIIIKEIYGDKSSPAELWAVMVKMKGDKNAGEDWLWAEFTPGGEVEYSVTKNGKTCIKCHKPGRDYVRLFDLVE